MEKSKKTKMENESKMNKVEEIVEIPQGVTVIVNSGLVNVKGAKGELKRNMQDPKIKMVAEGSEVKIVSMPYRKKMKTVIGSFAAHLRNMIKGVQDGVNYKLKICSGHFPMNVSVSGNQFVVKNFLGEKVPRTIHLNSNVKVKIEGEMVMVEGLDKELVSQTAASIETLTMRVGFDRRIFQDGIYIVEKNGKKVI